jgi:RNA polymerase sigma factor (sigma-70 family)
METSSASTDAELLRAWSSRRCEESFRALVAKYLGLVHGLVVRRTRNAQLADEVAQTVFTRLAARAGGINAQPTLAPWLHHCAWCETVTALRRESTRRRHMNAYAHHLRTSQDGGSASALHTALPHLDDALRALRGDDQRIVLMRFYEGRGLRDIAAVLGKTEAAVRKQGQRALEKMALRLRRQGAVVSAAALAAGLGAALTQPASAAAVASISAAATATGVKLTLLDHVLTLMNTKTRTALLTAACMTVPLVWQWQRASGLEERLANSEKNTALKGRLLTADARNAGPLGRNSRAAGPAADVSGKAAGSVAEWEWTLKNPDPLQRSQHLAALMASLTPESAPQVGELFKRLRREDGSNQYETEHRHFLRAWGRLNGEAALASVAGGDGKPNASSESLAALAGWAQSSPEKARAWLDALPEGDARTGLAFGIVDGWSLTDFDAASAFAAAQPRSTVRDQFRSLLLQRALAAGGVQEAQRWFTGIPTDEHNTLYKQRAFDELIGAMMQRDPAGASEWITRMGRQNFMSGDSIPQVAIHLASSSPGEALRWLESLGMGEGEATAKTSQGYSQVMDAWSKKDPAAAGTWLQSHSDHPAYDGMAASLASRVARKDGPAGLEWADSIQNPDQRKAARDQVARTMLKSQGETARATLASAGYSADEISKLGNSQREELYAQFLSIDRDTGALSNSLRARERDLEMATRLAKENAVAIAEEERARAAAEAARAEALLVSEQLNRLHRDLSANVSTNDARYSLAHPNGAPANCGSCHK